MAAFDAVLLYDGDCPFCTAAARAVATLDRVGIVAWESAAAQAFLDAQCASVPFTLVFIDRAAGTVSFGRDAARAVADRAGLPSLVGAATERRYESIATAVQTVSGTDRPFDAVHGQAPLVSAAEAHLPTVWDAAVATPDDLV